VTRAVGPRDSPSAHRGVCTVCPLLCDDVVPRGERLQHACDAGAAAWVRARVAVRAAAAWIDGQPADTPAAIGAAATLLAASRRVLVTGLAGATLEAITGGCDIAETLGAAVDAGAADTARPIGPLLTRVGGVTADWEELRDRADLVILWFHDPSLSHPRFSERFLDPPLPHGRRRQVFVVGPAVPGGYRHLPLPATAATDAARALEIMLSGVAGASPVPAGTTDPAIATASAALHAAIADAECVAIVTGPPLTVPTGDDTGIDAWSISHLVQALAHRLPAFEIPLGPGIAGGAGGNVAGAAAVCTWRYGAAGGIARADRDGGEFRPAEDDASRLITRGEIDGVLAVGELPATVEAALVAAGPAPAVVRVCDAGAPLAGGARRVQLRSTSLLLAPEGTMLRGDGRWTPLWTPRSARLPSDVSDSGGSPEAILRALHESLHALLRQAEPAARGASR